MEQHNYSFLDFDLEDLYHPNAEKFNRIFIFVTFPLISIIYFFMIYTILMKSTAPMRVYKYLLVLQVTWCYFWELSFFFCKPMMLWPMKMGYCDGFLNSHDSAKIALPAVLCATVGVIHSNAMLFLYRLVATYDRNKFVLKVIEPKVLFCIIFLSLFFFETLVLSITFLDPVRVEDMQEIFKNEIPVLNIIFTLHPFTAGYHPSLSNGLIDWLLLIAAIAAYLFPPLLILLCGFYYYRLIYIKKHIAPANYRVHRMLFR